MILKISGGGGGGGKKKLLCYVFLCSIQDEPYVFVISHNTIKQEQPSDPPLGKNPGSAHDFWFVDAI